MKKEVRIGLRENAFQFWTLVLVNAFVGGMVGLERSILPEIGEEVFGIESHTAILSFIIAFGVTKAAANYFAGRWANILGRRKLLVIGWLFALPVPFILMSASSWNWVVIANIFLGINQGLAWSSTVVMKIDLVGDKDRGLAMGLNEFSGYFAVGLVTFVTAWIADAYGLRPYPFYLGVVLSFLGLMLSIAVVKDTFHHVTLEATNDSPNYLDNIFFDTTFRHRNLSTTTQAGLVNNLNDGMIWGLLPLLLMTSGFAHKEVGIVTAVYPTVWGISQLLTGKMADIWPTKKILFWGMFLQGLAIMAFSGTSSMSVFVILSVILGIGTALVYPTFFVIIARNTHPVERAESIGVFRLWRDLGYAVGAILSGVISDVFGLSYAVLAVGLLTILSALVIKVRMS